jgi:hypothetical protein
MDAVMRIEGFRALGDNIIETVINKSEGSKNSRTRPRATTCRPRRRRNSPRRRRSTSPSASRSRRS